MIRYKGNNHSCWTNRQLSKPVPLLIFPFQSCFVWSVFFKEDGRFWRTINQFRIEYPTVNREIKVCVEVSYVHNSLSINSWKIQYTTPFRPNNILKTPSPRNKQHHLCRWPHRPPPPLKYTPFNLLFLWVFYWLVWLAFIRYGLGQRRWMQWVRAFAP